MAITIDYRRYRRKIFFQQLSKIYGLGLSRISFVAKICGFNAYTRMGKIPIRYITRFQKYVSDTFKTGRALKQEKQAQVKFLWSIRTYRGLRLHQGLPARGQRTKTNAKTARKMGRIKDLYFRTDQAPGARISGKPASFGLDRFKLRKHDPRSRRVKRKVTRKK